MCYDITHAQYIPPIALADMSYVLKFLKFSVPFYMHGRIDLRLLGRLPTQILHSNGICSFRGLVQTYAHAAWRCICRSSLHET